MVEIVKMLFAEWQSRSSEHEGRMKCWNSTLEYYTAMQNHISDLNTTGSLSERSGDLTNEKESNVLEALAQLYVSDGTTGFVYANIDVFMCFASSNSVPCMWQLNTWTTKELLLGSEFKQSFDVSFTPAPFPCNLNAVDRCDENSELCGQRA